LIVLASGSPRRRDYLTQIGARFEVLPAEVDETTAAGEAPEDAALRLAREKARAVQRLRPDRWILAADTIVAVEAEILGKPRDRDDARRMLRLLAGREHRVVTGVVLLDPKGDARIDRAVITRVRFRPLGEAEITAYLAGGEADDKAGAYGIQGAAAAFVEGIDGSLSNVVGLPLEVLEPVLRRHALLPQNG
jgi:septum formation protein